MKATMERCVSCRKIKPCTRGTDPFADMVCDNQTELWLCVECYAFRHEAAIARLSAREGGRK